MSLLIPTNRGGRCGLCLEDFNIGEHQLNHPPLPPHRPHDGFHLECLRELYHGNPTRFVCPYDQCPLDPTSLVSRTERMFAILKPAFVNAAYAAVLGGAAGVPGAMVGMATGAVGARLGLAGIRLGLAGARLGLAGSVFGIAGAALGIPSTVIVATGVVAVALGAAAGATAGATVGAALGVTGAAVGAALGAAAGAALVVTGAVEAARAARAAGAELEINLIVGRLGGGQIAHDNIVGGIFTGVLTTMMAMPWSDSAVIAVPLTAIISGVAAGAFSLIRR